MYKTKLRNVGGSIIFAIPKPILKSLGLAANDDVGLSVSGSRLIVERYPRKRYTLNELIAQCDLGASLTDEDRRWLDDALQGREAI